MPLPVRDVSIEWYGVSMQMRRRSARPFTTTLPYPASRRTRSVR